MKKKKMLEAMNLIDDAYIREADPAVAARRRRRFFQRVAAVAACLCLMVVSLNLWLFLPYDRSLPDVSRYAGSEYYPLIQKLNAVTYVAPAVKNNYDAYIRNTLKFDGIGGNMPTDGPDMDNAPGDAGSAPPTSGVYEEVTDNQVAGVIEADLIKRSSTHIYYLRADMTLAVYSIACEDSEKVGSYKIQKDSDMRYVYTGEWEFYLSADCKTVLVVAPYSSGNTAMTAVIALDVSDPANIQEKHRVRIRGSYHSSRLVNGELLLFSEFAVGKNPDFSKEENFLPQIDTGDGMQSLPMEGILSPDTLTSSRYLVICKLDENALSLRDSMAFLSYSDTLYVTGETVYVTRDFDRVLATEGVTVTKETATEIAGISYSGEKFEKLGTVTVAGTLHNQYSMDEHEGILRLVTGTTVTRTLGADVVENLPDDVSSSFYNKKSANLYCVDLSTWQVAAQVVGFAPVGETVESVRFDGHSAYVCTAIVQPRPTDPVFFFDLSDLSNITYKDTGTIDGYSHSLVSFGDGYLLGIGVGDTWDTFKVEIYEETETGVAAVCCYEQKSADFSRNYKAYYIDYENRLIGFGIYSYSNGFSYVLLHFDGYELRVLSDVPLQGAPDSDRAVYIDGYLYMFSTEDFKVVQIAE